MGTAGFHLSRWFVPTTELNGPQDDFERERILTDVYAATHFGESVTGEVIVKTPLGVCCVVQIEDHGARLVVFDHVADNRWEHKRFWMNTSSVKGLMEQLHALPRADFNDLFLYGRP